MLRRFKWSPSKNSTFYTRSRSKAELTINTAAPNIKGALSATLQSGDYTRARQHLNKNERYEMVKRNLARTQTDTIARIDEFIKDISKKEKRLEKFRKEQRLDNDITKEKKAVRANAPLTMIHNERADAQRDSMNTYAD